MTEHMQAVGFHEHGPVDNYELLTVDRPEPAADEVVLDVRASALNYMDLFAVRELDHYVPDYPFWTGGDVAGTVAELGDDVSGWTAGDRVLVDPFLSCGECSACRRGERLYCDDFRMLGEMRHGGHAEYLAIPADALLSIPEDVSFETAASIPTAGGTAWRALTTRGDLRSTEEMLIVGATGGVGTFATQIATEVFNVRKLYATTSTDQKADFLSDLGVDHVINYTEEDFDRRVWELTDKTGVDVVYNCVGGPTWTQSMRALRNGGRLITSGATAGPNPETELRLLFIRQLEHIGSSGATATELESLCEYVWDGTIEPVIQETFSLSEYEEAFRKMDDRELYGKVLFVQD
ncbi:zinc-binding dehydrogenase [Halobacteria archaeon AArc-dxtr1]|nr:zinc-binding dehydrogenase [Halobacteria archaeon AArc-dxtr1]